MSVLDEIANEKQEMEMTPMIDVTFLLLIFFMCTIKFKTLEGKLSAFLPKDVGSNTTQAEPKETIKVKMTVVTPGVKLGPRGEREYDPATDERFTYGDDRQITISVQSRTYATFDEARDRLVELKQLGADEPDPVEIDPRKGVVYAEVAKALDAVLQADFTEVTFSGSYEE